MAPIPSELKIKILEKIYGICYMRKLEGQKTTLTIPEFKFIIGVYRIKKENWYSLAKDFESRGFVKMHCRNPIEVNLSAIAKN